MKLVKTDLEGVFIIENFYSEDIRGSFIKTYHKDLFEENNLCTSFRESYYSISQKGVVRGMHFQLPPYDHEKLIYIAQGEVVDVVLDLRKSSKTYGKSIEINISEKKHISVYIPKGLAHGFKVNVDNTIMIYNVSTVYNNKYDFGIRFDSFGFDWKIESPILSERDKSLIDFTAFDKINPF